MAYGSISLEKRIKENIKDYTIGQLLDMTTIQRELEMIAKLTGTQFLLTRRHGEAVILIGDWPQECVDVLADPGKNIRVAGRTVGHLYVRYAQNKDVVEDMVSALIEDWQSWGENTYLYKETDQYVYEVQSQAEEELNRKTEGTRTDALTGALTHTYFRSRMKVLDRSQTAPIAAICVNINDWKFAYDHFGVEESDRLIRIVADILKSHAKPEYIIGRVDGDVFNVMIPMPEEDEVDLYVKQVQQACNEFEDSKLAPSVAIGVAMKTNVEEDMLQVFSDAEYEMFENKVQMKQDQGYKARLEKGL